MGQKSMGHYGYSTAFAALALVGAMAFAIPAQALQDGASSTLILAQGTTTTPDANQAMPKKAMTHENRAEARIKELHAKLKITPDQEQLWNALADVMRSNAQAMDELMQNRFSKGTTMNAVDDLKSYAEITDAHAAGVKKFIPPFEALYNAMSDSQKKIADALFRSRLKARAKKAS